MKNFYKTKNTYKVSVGTTITEPSKTVKGESMTIKELLVRFSNGMPLTQKTPVYFDEPDLEKINRFFRPDVDLTDLAQLNDHVNFLKSAVERAQAEAIADPNNQPELPNMEPENA